MSPALPRRSHPARRSLPGAAREASLRHPAVRPIPLCAARRCRSRRTVRLAAAGPAARGVPVVGEGHGHRGQPARGRGNARGGDAGPGCAGLRLVRAGRGDLLTLRPAERGDGPLPGGGPPRGGERAPLRPDRAGPDIGAALARCLRSHGRPCRSSGLDSIATTGRASGSTRPSPRLSPGMRGLPTGMSSSIGAGVPSPCAGRWSWISRPWPRDWPSIWRPGSWPAIPALPSRPGAISISAAAMSMGHPGSVGIRHPRIPGCALIDTLALSNMAVCTSGDYERRVDAGPISHHLLDPAPVAPPPCVPPAPR